jgi:DNA-binding MarR family transcriptional regulator
MHKTRSSRAVGELSPQGVLSSTASPSDRRELPFSLTAKGRRLYHKLVPLALACKRKLFSCLGRAEIEAFLDGLVRLERGLGVTPGK